MGVLEHVGSSQDLLGDFLSTHPWFIVDMPLSFKHSYDYVGGRRRLSKGAQEYLVKLRKAVDRFKERRGVTHPISCPLKMHISFRPRKTAIGGNIGEYAYLMIHFLQVAGLLTDASLVRETTADFHLNYRIQRKAKVTLYPYP